ncbi:MAG: hypothetical protein ACOZIN_00010 [Myxococcota bacterium]
MGRTKQKAVISAGKEQLEEVKGLIRARRYRTVSEFVSEAIAEKLEKLHREELSEQVERYCAKGHAWEDTDLIDAQAFEPERRRAKR